MMVGGRDAVGEVEDFFDQYDEGKERDRLQVVEQWKGKERK